MNQIEIRADELGLTSRNGLHATGTAARMRQAISAASIGACSDAELETAARDLVIDLRSANEPPEQVVLVIKRILAQAGLRPSHPPSDPAMVIERHSAVYRTVIALGIHHYFASNDGAGSRA
jgi:hypothetical protein